MSPTPRQFRRARPGQPPTQAAVAPRMECQLDFGNLGLLDDPVTGQRPDAAWGAHSGAHSAAQVHALIFTACYSRHMFVWLTFSQTLAALIAGPRLPRLCAGGNGSLSG